MSATYPNPLKIDFGCGDRKEAGWFGIDSQNLPGVDLVTNLDNFPLPFEDNSVDEARCVHFIEHVQDIMRFMNEVYRILKVGSTMMVYSPYYSSMRAWQDPTHVNPISEYTFLYYNKNWRVQNKLLHYPITCDFDFTYGYVLHPNWANRAEEARQFAITHYINVVLDIQVVLTKRPPEEVKK